MYLLLFIQLFLFCSNADFLYASPKGGPAFYNGGIVQTTTFDDCLVIAKPGNKLLVIQFPGDVVQLLPGIYNGKIISN